MSPQDQAKGIIEIEKNSSSSTGSFSFTGVTTTGSANCSESNIQIETKVYSFNGPEITSEWETYNFTSCDIFRSGVIDVTVTANNITRNFEPFDVGVVQNFEQTNSPIPDGGFAKLDATPNTSDGCEFLGWREAGEPMFTNNEVFYFHSDDPSTSFIAEFECPGNSNLF